MSEKDSRNPSEITDLISRHKGHIILEAGAGTGKTYSLTERVIHQLAECRIPLERMLALTFTDFAAAEMRSRIYEAINRRLNDTEQVDSERDHLVNTRRRFSRNHISTFHSFCNRILQYFPDEITEISVFSQPFFGKEGENGTPDSISPDGAFELLSDYDEVLWILEWKKSFYGMYKHHAGLQRQLSRLSVSDFESFMQKLSGMDEEALHHMSMLTPESYIDLLKKLAGIWRSEVEERMHALLVLFTGRPEWFKKRENIPLTMADLKKYRLRSGNKGFVRSLFDIQEMGEDTYEEICAAGKELFELQDELDNIEPWLSNRDTVLNVQAYPDSGAEYFDANHEAYWNMRDLAELALRWSTLMRFKRFESGYLNYDDMIWLTCKLFRENPRVVAQMRNRFDQILVDEFQDTDRRQWEIIRSLGFGGSGDRKETAGDRKEILIVGDVKQAIYGFRGGDVAMMGVAHDEMAKISSGPEALPLKVMPLAYSFRSNRTVIRFANRLFRHVFGERDEVASYEAHHQPLDTPSGQLSKNASADGEIRVLFADCKKLRQENEAFSIPASALADNVMLLEARRIARFLKEIVEGSHAQYSSITEKMGKGKRAVGVLYKRRTHMYALEQALMEVGLPYTVAKGTRFYQRREIWDAWLLLSFLLDAYDDISLVGLLRSPMISVSDSGLLSVRMVMDTPESTYPNFWSAVSENEVWGGDLLNDEDRYALEEGVRFLKKLRERVPGSRVSELLEQAFFTCGAYFGGSSGDVQTRENVVKLTDVVRSLENSGRGTLFEITEFLANRIREEARDNEAEQPDPAPVQLMTVHGSKGLQFPMVVIPDMYAGQNDGGMQLYTSDDDRDSYAGPSIAYKTGNREGTDDTEASFLYQVLKSEKQKREIAETKRLFYVAVTRAETHVLLSMARPAKSGVRGSFAGFLGPLLQEEPSGTPDDIVIEELTVEELEELAVDVKHRTFATRDIADKKSTQVNQSGFKNQSGSDPSADRLRVYDRRNENLVHAVRHVSSALVSASDMHQEAGRISGTEEAGFGESETGDMWSDKNVTAEQPVFEGVQPANRWNGMDPADAGTIIHRTLELGMEEEIAFRKSGKNRMRFDFTGENADWINEFWYREMMQMGYSDLKKRVEQNCDELLRHCRNAVDAIQRIFGDDLSMRFEAAFEWSTWSLAGTAENSGTGPAAADADDKAGASIKADQVTGDAGSGKTVTMRGKIDLIICDRNGLDHIVDIKTGPPVLKSPDVWNLSEKPSGRSQNIQSNEPDLFEGQAGMDNRLREYVKSVGYDRQIRVYQQAYGAITGKKVPNSRVWLLFTWPDGGYGLPLSKLAE